MSYAAAQFWTEWFTLRVATVYELDATLAAQCMLSAGDHATME